MTVSRATGALEAKQVVRALVDPWAELRRIRALIRSLVLKAMIVGVATELLNHVTGFAPISFAPCGLCAGWVLLRPCSWNSSSRARLALAAAVPSPLSSSEG